MVLINRVAKGIGSLVGLGQEAYAHNQKKKAAAQERPSSVDDVKAVSGHMSGGSSDKQPSVKDDHGRVDSDDEDEFDWLEDEAGMQLRPSRTRSNENGGKSTSAFDWFTERHPGAGQFTQLKGQLPTPVIVPQKRPGTQVRGFVSAYAPALASCNVDQAEFLDFLDGFRRQAEGQGAFNVVNLAVGISSSVIPMLSTAVPSLAVQFGATAVQIALEAGRRSYINKRTNSYLDGMNANFFQPRGLYALVMTYDPNSEAAAEVVDFDSHAATAISKRATPSMTKPFRTSSGETLESQMPEVCELVFPSVASASEEEKDNAFKRSFEFTKDYFDRRSQASYAAQNPESTLNVGLQEHEFAGRYADPTTFENSGLLGVMTGGVVDPMARVKGRRQQKQTAKGQSGQQKQGGFIRTARRKLREGVLYLLVVNMPSDAELNRAKEMLAKRQPVA